MLKLCERGLVFVIIAFLNRSHWAEKECQLSLCKPTKIDGSKHDESSTSFAYEMLAKMRKSLGRNYSAGKVSQVASSDYSI